MENRIPIDELFRKNLGKGREQLNLGAWANMERMLDGQNPYSQEEKKKRRIFPFLLFALLGAGTLSTAYYFNSHPSDSGKHANRVAQVVHTPKNSMASATNHSSVIKSEPSEQTPNNTPVSPVTSNAVSVIPSHPSEVNSTIPATASTVNPIQGWKQKSYPSAENKKQKADATAHERKSDRHSNASSHTDGSDVNENMVASAAPLPSFDKKEIPVVELTQKSVLNRDGSIQQSIDTSGKSTVTQWIPRVTPLDYSVTNPRYRELSAEEDALAMQQSTLPEPVVASTQSEAISGSRLALQKSTLIVQKKKNTTTHHTSYFDDLRRFGNDQYQKLIDFVKYGFRPDTYTGISMGINASLNNAHHNFGGFQGGLTNLKPINEYVSLLTELKFYYRNNGGYTVNDIYYRILNYSEDSVSLAHQRIYSYQKDSSIRTFNFKNFYSLELPIMLQLNYRSFSLYGGANLAYGFKLPVSEKYKNYVVNVTDTLPASSRYEIPADKGSQYLRSDFSSRFGLGYTVGASYSFSPQLYLDLRISQTVWDNMKTNAARDISNGFFKVPNIQFALGYRFRNFRPGN